VETDVLNGRRRNANAKRRGKAKEEEAAVRKKICCPSSSLEMGDGPQKFWLGLYLA
jgi:hypothetical protein